MKRWSPKFSRAVIVAACVALFAVSGYAQFQTGNIYGKVQAKDGAVLPGVSVTLTGVGAPQTVVTDASGNFPNRLQADRGGQAADVLDLGILVKGVSRLMAAIHPDLAFDTQVIGGHEVVTE